MHYANERAGRVFANEHETCAHKERIGFAEFALCFYFLCDEGLRLPSLVVPGPGWLASWGKLSATAQASCCACGKEMQIGPIIRVTANGDAPMALAVQKSDLSMQHMNRLLDVYTTNAPNPKPTISVQLTPGV